MVVEVVQVERRSVPLPPFVVGRLNGEGYHISHMPLWLVGSTHSTAGVSWVCVCFVCVLSLCALLPLCCLLPGFEQKQEEQSVGATNGEGKVFS